MHIKRHHIHNDLAHDKPVQKYAKHKSYKCAKKCKDRVFPSNICCCLILIKTKHLDRCDLTHTLCNINIRQVI